MLNRNQAKIAKAMTSRRGRQPPTRLEMFRKDLAPWFVSTALRILSGER